MERRVIASLCLFVLLASPMAAWEHDSHQIPDDEFLSDGASTFERDVAPIGAEPTELITDEVPPAVSEKNDSGSFVGRVLELKAWAVAASKISFYHDFSGKKKNPLFALIQEYSKTPKNDPVTQYGLVVGKLESMQTGVGTYILEHLNRALKKGSVVVQGSKGTYKMSYEAIGLQTEPVYLKKLAVKSSVFYAQRAKLKDSSAKAIKYWEDWYTEQGFEAAHGRLRKHYLTIQAKKDAKCNEKCVGLIRQSFMVLSIKTKGKKGRKVDRLHPLSTTCQAMWENGDFKAPKACLYNMPSGKALHDEAMKIAKANLVKHARSIDMSRIENENEERERKKRKAAADKAAAEKAAAEKAAAVVCHYTYVSRPNYVWPKVLDRGGGHSWNYGSLPSAEAKCSTLANCAAVTKDNNGYNLRDASHAGHSWTGFNSWERKKECISSSPPAPPRYYRKYAKKWPHCSNISCPRMGQNENDFVRECNKHSSCTGFSFPHGKTHGHGCLKKCGSQEFGGYGHGSHDYIAKVK